MYRLIGKRAFDVALSFTGLVLAAAPMATLAGVVWWRLGAPVLFRARRPGLDGKLFVLYKFRTMTNATDAEGRRLPARDRVTPLGRFLRRTSLDELPQLFNVLKGDMSL